MWSCFSKINPRLVLIKVHFFLFFASLSVTVPYIPVIAKNFGVSASAIGTVTICICICGLAAKPLIGAIADHLHMHKETLMVVVIVTNFLYLGLDFIPPTIHPGLVSLTANVTGTTNGSVVNINTTKDCFAALKLNHSIDAFCAEGELETFNTTLWLLPNSTVNSKNLVIYNDTEDQITTYTYLQCTLQICSRNMEVCGDPDLIVAIYRKHQFWVFLVIVLFSRAGTVAIVSLSDTAIFDLLGGNTENYGKQRLWGAVGWGAFSVIGGLIIKMASVSDDDINYSPGFYLMFILGVLDAITLWFIKLDNPNETSSILKNVGSLLKNTEVMSFLLIVFAIGSLTGLQWNYFYWYINSLGANSLLLGIALCIQCFLGEVPFFFVSGKIIKKVGSLNALTFTFFSFGVRFLVYSFITNPWWVLPIELLEGTTFGLFYSVITSHAKAVAPKGTEATVQGLVGGTFDGLGVALGALFGGLGIDHLGGRFTFRYAAVVAFVMGALHLGIRVTQHVITSQLSDKEVKASKKEEQQVSYKKGQDF